MTTQATQEMFQKAFPSETLLDTRSSNSRRDPQWELHGHLFVGTESDQIVFEIPLLRFTLSCTATVPPMRKKYAPVVLQYLPFPPRARIPGETLQQDVVQGRFWTGSNSDCILFHFDIMLFRFFCIVSIPEEGSVHSKIYVAHKLLLEPRQ